MARGLDYAEEGIAAMKRRCDFHSLASSLNGKCREDSDATSDERIAEPLDGVISN
jgi:hypothetical protein